MHKPLTLDSPQVCPSRTRRRDWVPHLAPYKERSYGIGLWQVGSTLAAYFAAWIVLWQASEVLSYPLTFLLCVPTALLLVRLFVLQHDCGHRSLLPSSAANHTVGTILSLFTLVPYFRWRQTHAMHHATSSNMAKRRIGRDIYTMTVKEYRAANRWRRFYYRVYRNPFILFGLLPGIVFLGEQRLAYEPTLRRREKLSAYGLNAAIVLMFLAAHLTLGLDRFFPLWLSVFLIGSSTGVWLFYVQHQFPEAYWAKEEEWSFVDAALKGSSYYRLPAPLRYLTASIGYHHIHHLEPRMPNYRLKRCHEEVSGFDDVPSFGPLSSLHCVFANLWDEDQKRLISFREYDRATAALSAEQ